MSKKKEKLYRYVSDFGFGDKSWLIRFMDAKEALDYYNKARGTNYTEICDSMFDTTYEHYIEEDDYNDTEDWDWMDS